MNMKKLLLLATILSFSTVAHAEVRVKNVWHVYDTLNAVVTYTNTSNKTFDNGVTITCKALDSDGNVINTGEQSFYNNQYGAIKPGFTGKVKVLIDDAPRQKVKKVNCTFNGW